jgi:hypothetical protein
LEDDTFTVKSQDGDLWTGLDWTHLAQEWDKWRSDLSTEINYQAP